MPETIDERRRLLEERLAWLRHAVQRVQNEKKRALQTLWLLVLVVPAGVLWGVAGALLALSVVVFLAGCAFYIVWNHRVEYESEIEMVRQSLAQLDAPPQAPPPPVRRRRPLWL